jgi:hypothetical protein
MKDILPTVQFLRCIFEIRLKNKLGQALMTSYGSKSLLESYSFTTRIVHLQKQMSLTQVIYIYTSDLHLHK